MPAIRPRLATLAAALLAVLAPVGQDAQAAPVEPVYRLAQQEKPALFDTMKDLVSIESGSKDIEGLDRIADLIRDRLAALGGDAKLVAPAEVYRMDDTPEKVGKMVHATFKGTGKRKIMLIAHMDTVYLRGMLALNSQTGAPPSWFDEQLSAAYRQAWAQPGTVRAGLSYYRASQFLNPVDGDERASGATRSEDLDLTTRVPTQFIWGERDGFLLSGCIEDIEPLFTNLRVARIPEGSHWVIHEHGETVAQRISAFVDSLDLSGGEDDPGH